MMYRIRRNVSFLLAGAILAAVAFNVYYEVSSSTKGSEPVCLSTSTP